MTDPFLEAKALESGVRKLNSGLLFRVLATGDGELSPEADSLCNVLYEGRLTDGKVFDGSGDVPSTFSPDQVIPAWNYALQMMREGDSWELYVPSELGYGAKGSKPAIKPHATLVFTMTLVKVQIGGKSPEKAQALLQKNLVSSRSLEERVTAVYAVYCPEKLPTVAATCEKYAATPGKLMTALISKYGPEPEV